MELRPGFYEGANELGWNEQPPYLDSKNNFESLILTIPSSKDINRYEDDLIERFNVYGALVVKFEKNEEPREQLLCFKSIFGETTPHDRADKDMIAEIAVSEKFPGYLGTSNAEHYFHTDGAYDDLPPCATALRCEIPANHGGITKLVSGEALYRYLSTKNDNMLRALFQPNALCVERAGNRSCQPVFQNKDNRIFIRYRADATSTYSKDPAAQSAFMEIKTFLDDPQNYMAFTLQPKQVLLTDNTRILHARTTFPLEEPRKMHRLFFSGNNKPNNNIVFGFLP